MELPIKSRNAKTIQPLLGSSVALGEAEIDEGVGDPWYFSTLSSGHAIEFPRKPSTVLQLPLVRDM